MTTNTTTANTTADIADALRSAQDATETLKATTIRPGLLVQIKSTVDGGVAYNRVDLDADGNVAQEGADVTRWETTRVIEDKAEYEAAIKVRSKAQGEIRKLCQATSFGLLCPADREGALRVAVARARALVAEHNNKATHTKVAVYVIVGRVAADDAEAAASITQEIGELITAMDRGIANVNTDEIRKAATRARELSAMLDDRIKGKVENAIEQARKAARTITARVEKAGEDAKIVLLDIQRGQIESARIAFLDLTTEAQAEAAAAMPAVDLQRMADLDVSASDDSGEREPVKAPPASVPTLDLAEGSAPVAVTAPSVNVRAMELS